MAAHALLSPSGASRWLTCTPSVRIEETYPLSTNTAAEEGTLAHSLCELYLKNFLGLSKQAVFKNALKRIKANPLYNAEMDGHCMDYVQFVTDRLADYGDDYSIFIEEKTDLTEYAPECFGTLDLAIVSNGLLEIIDLKYGKGVLVEAHENKQLMLYALGAYKKYSLLFPIKEVVMNIFQPRLSNFSAYALSIEDLLAWGENEVKPKAQLAWDGEGEFVAGAHCKFCKASSTCKALADYNMDLAKYVFEDPNKLSDDDISGILEKAADFTTWLNNIKTYALQQAVLHGKKWPRFKLVEGRSVRVYADPEAILKKLKKTKFDSALYLTEPKLVGIGALEKNIGKAEVAKLIGNLIVKPVGAATLVPSWDKRPELNSHEATIAAFENIEQ